MDHLTTTLTKLWQPTSYPVFTPKLMEAIAVRPGLTDVQRNVLDPAVCAFADNAVLERGTNKICIYIEACIAYKEQAGDSYSCHG